MTDKEKIKELEIELKRFKTLFEDTMDQLKLCNKKLAQTESQLKVFTDAQLEKKFKWKPLIMAKKYNVEQLVDVLIELEILSIGDMGNPDKNYSYKAGFVHLFGKEEELDSTYYHQINLNLSIAEIIDLFDKLEITGSHVSKMISHFLLSKGKEIDSNNYRSLVSQGVSNQKTTKDIFDKIEA